MKRSVRILVPVLGAGLLLPSTAFGYVGPGAGFAFAGSLFFFLGAVLLALATILFFPIRMAWIAIKRKRKGTGKALVRRVVVVGFDGLDPGLVEKFMADGDMPNFERLGRQGYSSKLATTFPSISPVAWSSFITGCSPGKHNIFDFLARDRRTYLPDLSSAQISAPRKVLKLGRYRIPLEQPGIRLLRRGKSFWKQLGEGGVFSAILRVPITFPAEEFDGVQLAAMCTPDLKGTQGSFTSFSTNPEDATTTGGERIKISRQGNVVSGKIPGPANSMVEGNPQLEIGFTITLDADEKHALMELDNGDSVQLEVGKYTDWVPLVYSVGLGQKVHGIARFLITAVSPTFNLYMTPINIDPENPALPISHPAVYSIYLAKSLGPFATLGLAEDTWALNERVINEDQFLEQAYKIQDERERMLWSELEKVRRGLVVCVFDGTDRIQHMFYRFIQEGHPAARGFDVDKYKNAIRDIYKRADQVVGKVLDKLGDDEELFVVSDHGFKSFHRGLNVNSWLRDQGYLVLRDGRTEGRDWYVDVDWDKTRAFGLGLSGLFINIKGRESKGIVERSEAKALKAEIIEKLRELRDPENGDAVVVNDAWDAEECYGDAPFVDNAPDVLIGYNTGYRVSWESVTGKITKDVLLDNVKAWSGDHCMDPRLVPGVIFTTRKLQCENPRIMDLGPTILELFGVARTPQMDGVSLLGPTRIDPTLLPSGKPIDSRAAKV